MTWMYEEMRALFAQLSWVFCLGFWSLTSYLFTFYFHIFSLGGLFISWQRHCLTCHEARLHFSLENDRAAFRRELEASGKRSECRNGNPYRVSQSFGPACAIIVIIIPGLHVRIYVASEMMKLNETDETYWIILRRFETWIDTVNEAKIIRGLSKFVDSFGILWGTGWKDGPAGTRYPECWRSQGPWHISIHLHQHLTNQINQRNKMGSIMIVSSWSGTSINNTLWKCLEILSSHARWCRYTTEAMACVEGLTAKVVRVPDGLGIRWHQQLTALQGFWTSAGSDHQWPLTSNDIQWYMQWLCWGRHPAACRHNISTRDCLPQRELPERWGETGWNGRNFRTFNWPQLELNLNQLYIINDLDDIL